MKRIHTSALAAGAALAVTGTLLVSAPVASAATAFDMPQPTVSYLPANQGNAIGSGAYLWLGGNTTLQTTVGDIVTGKIGTITFAEDMTPKSRTYTWYACPTRGAALANCTSVQTLTADGNASNSGYNYNPKPADIGKYLAMSVNQKYNLPGGWNQATITTDRAKDLQVVNNLPTTVRPAWGITGLTAGGKANLLLFPWTMPSDTTFASRTLNVWACDSANAGQVTTATWTTTGCTALGAGSLSGGNVNSNSATIVQVQTTAAMAGKTLVAEAMISAKAGNGVAGIFVSRSAGGTVPAAASGSAAAADASATPSPTATAPAPTEASSSASGANGGNSASSTTAATAIVPTVKIISTKYFKRGRATGVSIELTGRGKGTVGTGNAVVQLIKKGLPGEKASQRLKTTVVKSMKGFKRQTLSKKLRPGTYYLRVIYTDSRSKVQAGALKKISVR